ncbi:MAG TPA: hypothetical protein VGK61_04570 [Planctomycetota bacterium]
MTRRIMLLAALAAAGLSASCGAVGGRPEGFERRDYNTDPSLRFQRVSLDEIMRNPQEGPVEFDAILNRRDESVWQPYYTPFRPGDFKSFSVWPADAAVWETNGRARSIPSLYIANDSPEIGTLYEIERYAPVRIRGVVRSAFDSRPWIQVMYVESIGSPWFNDEALAALIRGLEDVPTNAARAMTRLNDALYGPLSPTGRAAAWKGMGWIHLSRKQYQEADNCYTRALGESPGDRQAADGLRRARGKKEPAAWSAETTAPPETGAPSSMAELKARYEALAAEHDTKCKALAEEHSKCAELNKVITAERDDLKKKMEAGGADSEVMKKGMEEKDAQIKTLTDKTTALEAERDEMKKKMEAGGADSEASKKMMEEKDAQIKTLTEKATALEAERDELKKKSEAGGADSEAMKKQMEEKDAQVKTLTEKVTALEAERDELKKKAESGGGNVDAMKKEIEEKDAQIKTLNQKVTEIEQSVKDRDETIKKQREEIEKLTEELKKKEGN